MLRETAPPGSSTERFEVISKFLTTTEEYLNKLSTKVASVKMTQEASEAAALAVSKARAQVTYASSACLPAACVFLQSSASPSVAARLSKVLNRIIDLEVVP